MLGAIAGDIVGSRFEGHPAPPVDFELFHPDCRFTDDTVCTLAVADALLQNTEFDRTLRHFVRRHPDRGYGGMFLQWAFTDDAPAYWRYSSCARGVGPRRFASDSWMPLATSSTPVDRW